MKAAGPLVSSMTLISSVYHPLVSPRSALGGPPEVQALLHMITLQEFEERAPGLPPLLRPDTPVPPFTMTDLGYLPIQMPPYSFTIITDVKVTGLAKKFILILKSLFGQ